MLLRDHEEFSFDTLIDLCGLDCSGLKEISEKFEARFCVVYHLLSTTNNHRLRVKLFCSGSLVPQKLCLLLMCGLLLSGLREKHLTYSASNFRGILIYEEYSQIMDLSAIPLGKDFPISGHSEVMYDPQEKRVVYQPVTIESREVVPRVVREDGYGAGE